MLNKQQQNAILLVLFIYTPTLTIPIKVAMSSGISVLIINLLILIISIQKNKLVFSKRFIYLFLTLNSLFLLNILIVSYQDLLMNMYIQFFFTSTLALFLTFKEIDFAVLQKSWYVMALISLIIWFFYFDFVLVDEIISYMFFGTSMSISFSIVFYRFITKRKIVDLIISLVIYVCIAILANRGAFITINLIVIFLILIKTRRKLILFVSGILFSVLFFLVDLKKSAIELILSLNSFLLANNINSYSVTKFSNMLIDGIVESSSGRDSLYGKAFEILETGLIPRGVGYFQHSTNINYPHNFILDFLVIFGFLGIPILIIFIGSIVLFYLKESNVLKKDVVTLLLIVTFTRLALSSTFIYEPTFWIILGLIFSGNHFVHRRKFNKHYKNEPIKICS